MSALAPEDVATLLKDNAKEGDRESTGFHLMGHKPGDAVSM